MTLTLTMGGCRWVGVGWWLHLTGHAKLTKDQCKIYKVNLQIGAHMLGKAALQAYGREGGGAARAAWG